MFDGKTLSFPRSATPISTCGATIDPTGSEKQYELSTELLELL